MNKDFADWYAIAHLEANHDLLQRRWSAIEAHAKSVKTSGVFELVRLFQGLAQRDGDARTAFETALHDADSAFTFTGRDNEVSVLAGACLVQIIERNVPNSINAALGIITASLQGLRNGHLIPAVEHQAKQFLIDQSAALRNVDGVPVKTVDVTKEQIDEVVNAFNSNSPPSASEPWSKIVTTQQSQIKTLTGQVSLLDRRYSLLREESDMLWWLTGRHSRTLETPIADIPISAVSLVVGKELAELTRVTPGPLATEAIAWRALSESEHDLKKQVQVSASVNAVDRAVRQRWLQPVQSHAALDLCPIHFAIAQSLAVEGPKEWLPQFKSAQRLDANGKLTPQQAARQCYCESLLLR